MYPAENRKKQAGKRGCMWLVLGLFVGLPLLLVCSGVLFLVGRDRSARAKVDAATQELASQGMPVDDQSFKTYVEQLASSEFTDEWMDLLDTATTESMTKSVADLPVLGNAEITVPPPASDASTETSEESDWAEDQVREFLETNESLIDQIEAASIRQLSLKKGVLFKREYDAMNTLLPNVQNLRTLARMNYLRGQVALHDGNSEQLANSVCAQIGIADVLKQDPLIISQLVHIALEMMSTDLLRQSLAHDALPASELEEILPLVLERINIDQGWSLGIIGERGLILSVFDDPSASGAQVPSIPLRSNDKLFFLEHMQNVLDVPTDDLNQFREALTEQEATLAAAANAGVFARLETLTTSLVMPSMAAAGDAHIRTAMQHRLAALSIATKIYESQNGRLPTGLAELEQIEALPPLEKLVPLGKKPFGYLADDKEAKLWGFSPRNTLETPASPLGPVSPEDAEMIEMWNWTVPAKDSATDN
ncbi:MAG: hypothetical protein AAGG44_12365 [Planctomycetota bacterium]